MRMIKRILTVLLMLALMCVSIPAFAVQADTVTRQCKFEVSGGKGKNVNDGDISTAWKPTGNNAKLLITLPANGAGYVRVEWAEEPESFIFAQYDADKQVLGSVSEENAYSGISQVFELYENARYVLITLTAKGQGISEAVVYSAGDLPADVQTWHSAFTKCDLMVVAAQPGDEFTCFGGLLPYYVGERGVNVQMVYMTGSEREQKAEALDAMWALGIKNYPEFLGLKSKGYNDTKGCLKAWGGKEALIGAMVERIRACKPEVIVSHDINGADGDPSRLLTAMLMEYAIAAAADAGSYPDSVEEYGTWQVKKLYLNMGTTGVIDFDWDAVYESLNGTPHEAARAAMEYYDGLKSGDAVAHDDSVYGLVYSGIGSDEYRDDFFENIASLDIERVDETEDAQPTPSPEPTFVPGLVFSPEPTATASPVVSGTAEEFGSAAIQVMKFVGIALGAILAITCCQALIYRFRRRRRRR